MLWLRFQPRRINKVRFKRHLDELTCREFMIHDTEIEVQNLNLDNLHRSCSGSLLQKCASCGRKLEWVIDDFRSSSFILRYSMPLLHQRTEDESQLMGLFPVFEHRIIRDQQEHYPLRESYLPVDSDTYD